MNTIYHIDELITPNTPHVELDVDVNSEFSQSPSVVVDDGCQAVDNEVSLAYYRSTLEYKNSFYRRVDSYHRGHNTGRLHNPEYFCKWQTKYGDYYTNGSLMKELPVDGWRSIDECFSHMHDSRVTGRYASNDFDCNRDYRVIVTTNDDRVMDIFLSYFDNRGNMRHLVLRGENKGKDGDDVSCSIHHTDPIILVNKRLYVFDKSNERLAYKRDVGMNRSIIYSDFITSTYKEGKNVNEYIPIYSFLNSTDNNPIEIKRISIDSKEPVYFLTESLFHPGLLFIITGKKIYTLNSRLEVILVVTHQNSQSSDEFLFDSIFDGYILLSNFGNEMGLDYNITHYITIPIGKSNWNVDRVIWLGYLKDKNRECHLSSLPKELIRLILEYTREWRYIPDMITHKLISLDLIVDT